MAMCAKLKYFCDMYYNFLMEPNPLAYNVCLKEVAVLIRV